MRIAILAAGSEGDVRPYVALGLGLKASGHEVCLAAFAGFQPLVTGQGLAFYPVPNPAATLESAPAWQAWQHSQGNSIRHLHNLRRVARLAGTAIEDMLDGFWAACQGAGAIVSSSTSLAGPHIAEKRGVAHVWALLQPMTRTRAFPYYLSPIRFPPESRFNLLTYIAAEHLFWQLFKWPINRWRQSTLGLRPLPAPGPYRSLDGAGDPILYGFSPSVVPRPADWGDGPCLAGYWFLDGPADWAPPADLVAFLAGGPPPVYVGLGRLSAPDTCLDLALRALRRLRCRGILWTGWGSVSQRELPDDVFAVGHVPHDWLFPRVTAVVHHGGVGTTAAALRAGVPSVCVPGFFDQPFWSRRVAELGAGPPPIVPKRLTVRQLAAALDAATRNPAIRMRAGAIAKGIRAESGVDRAVEYLNRHFAAL